jgi:hypothetical protein
MISQLACSKSFCSSYIIIYRVNPIVFPYILRICITCCSSAFCVSHSLRRWLFSTPYNVFLIQRPSTCVETVLIWFLKEPASVKKDRSNGFKISLCQIQPYILTFRTCKPSSGALCMHAIIIPSLSACLPSLLHYQNWRACLLYMHGRHLGGT